MTSEHVDLLVVGAGPAGTAAALRAADLGAKTVLVTRDAFGGMAANDGPIPVRTLAHAARLVREARQLSQYGIDVGEPHINYPRLLARAAEVVAVARDHSTFLQQIQKAGVKLYEHAGTARFRSPHVIDSAHAPPFTADKIILCTGGVSRPLTVPGAELTVTPAAAFGLTTVPASLIVIGAGATGAQVASIFNAFGSSIALYEAGLRIIPTEDEEVSATVVAAFREDGIAVRVDFGTIERFEPAPSGIRMTVIRDGTRDMVEAAFAVCAAGWMADTTTLGLNAAGVATDARGFVSVDGRLQTTAKHIFAAGDVTGRQMLVPQAVTDGYTAASVALGAPSDAWSGAEPIGSFTDPEYARVGLTEAAARSAHDVVVAKATYAETTRPTIDGRIRGFCKLVIDRADLHILGCHIVGERAVEVAQMASIAMTGGMTVRDLASIPLSFPTYANVLGRTALRAVHDLNAKAGGAENSAC